MQGSQKDLRRSQRINEKLPIVWHLKDSNVSGRGTVKNIGAFGMMLEADTQSSFSGNSVLSFEVAQAGQDSFIPALGRMVWSRQKGSHLLWGIEFVEPAQELVSRLREKIQIKISRIESLAKIKNITGTALAVIMIALVAISFSQQLQNQKALEQSHQLLSAVVDQQSQLYRTAVQQYAQKVSELEIVAADLEQTKSLLSEVQIMLAGEQEQNASLNKRISAMQAEYEKLTIQLSDAKERIRLYSGDIQDLSERKSALGLIRKGLRSIKNNIRQLKHKAHLARVVAQKERDRIALEIGNRGFVVGTPAAIAPAKSSRKVKINVSIAAEE
ncbi:MAG: PilZ domain-containing protein [Candidatus Omnitrophota bacterium]